MKLKLQKLPFDLEKKRDHQGTKTTVLFSREENELSLASVKQNYYSACAANETVEFYKNFGVQQSTKATREAWYAESEFNSRRSFLLSPEALLWKRTMQGSARV